MKFKKLFGLITTSIAVSAILIGCDMSKYHESVSTQTPMSSDISKKVYDEFPSIPKGEVKVSMNNDLNLWQVYFAGQMIYVTVDGKYFIGGHYFKFNDGKKDYTQDFIDSSNLVDTKKLPLDLAIKSTKGNGSNLFYVFSDPECPYCHMLQSQVINKLDNYTVYTFLFPLQAIHPSATSDSVKILCSNNPQETFESWMSVMPDNQKSTHDGFFSKLEECKAGKDKVNNLLMLGVKYNVNGTPTIITKDGKRMSPNDLVNLSKNNESSNK